MAYGQRYDIVCLQYFFTWLDEFVTTSCLLIMQVRKILFGPKEASYSGYTCYTGIADFVPPDIETVGYAEIFVLFYSLRWLQCTTALSYLDSSFLFLSIFRIIRVSA